MVNKITHLWPNLKVELLATLWQLPLDVLFFIFFSFLKLIWDHNTHICTCACTHINIHSKWPQSHWFKLKITYGLFSFTFTLVLEMAYNYFLLTLLGSKMHQQGNFQHQGVAWTNWRLLLLWFQHIEAKSSTHHSQPHRPGPLPTYCSIIHTSCLHL